MVETSLFQWVLVIRDLEGLFMYQQGCHPKQLVALFQLSPVLDQRPAVGP
jgi:hypothetical protein